MIIWYAAGFLVLFTRFRSAYLFTFLFIVCWQPLFSKTCSTELLWIVFGFIVVYIKCSILYCFSVRETQVTHGNQTGQLADCRDDTGQAWINIEQIGLMQDWYRTNSNKYRTDPDKYMTGAGQKEKHGTGMGQMWRWDGTIGSQI